LKTFRSLIVTLTVAALFVGCGGGSGVRFSDLFDESAAAEGTGVQFSGLVRAVVILAKHDATARQRQVAEQNGRRAVAKLQARMATSSREAAPAPKKPRPKKTSASAKVAKPEPQSEPATAQPKSRKKLPRIIAVATEKDERTDKKAAKAVMLFDTHAQQIIGNKVYDIESEPQTGEEVRFETHSTSYIGASL
jgi:type IV secretory pathway VirB10-like protein